MERNKREIRFSGISEAIDADFVDRIANVGVYSSFELIHSETVPEGVKRKDLDVFSRWQQMKEHPRMVQLLKDEELREISKNLFDMEV